MGTHSLREDKAAREREDKALRLLTDQLVADYTATHAEQDVRTVVGEARNRFAGHAIRDFIPILVERVVRRTLDGEHGPIGESAAVASAAPMVGAAAEATTGSVSAPVVGSAAAVTVGSAAAATVGSTAAPSTGSAAEAEVTAAAAINAATTPTARVAAVTGSAATVGSATAPTVSTGSTAAEGATGSEAAVATGSAAEAANGSSAEVTSGSVATPVEGSATETASGSAAETANVENTSAEAASGSATEATSGSTVEAASGSTAAPASVPVAEAASVSAVESASGSTAETATGPATESATAATESSASSTPPPGAANRSRFAAKDLLPPPWSGRNLIGPVAAAIVLVVVLALTFGTGGGGSPQSPTAAAPSVTTVHGVIGSEKLSYFNDPKVVAALAEHGLRVQVEAAGSRQIYTSVDLNKFDFAFPSSTPAAEAILRARNITTQYTPFSSPMAIATFKPIVDLLTAAGVVRPGPVPTLDMQRYLDLVGTGTQWNQLPGNTTYSVPKNILVSTTDPRSSNSAAMYLSIASYVVNDNTIVRGTTAEDNAVQKVSKLFVGQGYSDNSSKGPFDEYLSGGMGPTPMVLIYEAQYVEAALAGKITPDMVLMYPSPTVLSRHTLVPMNSNGDRLGKLLTTDPELQQLAAEHGFRTNDPAQFTSVTSQHQVPVNPQVVDVVDAPSYDTLQHLLDGVARAYN
ncbi:three-helix bundle dimerization domain-containing protein [Nocardia macrotermitis]|uniref:Uncharacterized protein n=1 Tax=Nocardia macrotermitis TaxID=2585198 RepID=A0A7K0D111_9NOCA|nr:hypothetical protein [Nocardia macrotermitis]MQY18624.1 hypothetical protein [Nocardia macrotermitis]